MTILVLSLFFRQIEVQLVQSSSNQNWAKIGVWKFVSERVSSVNIWRNFASWCFVQSRVCRLYPGHQDIHSTGKLFTTFRLYFYCPKMSVIYRVHKKQCCPISVHERFTCRSISTNFPIQPSSSSPAQPGSPAQPRQPSPSVWVSSARVECRGGAGARLAVHRQTQRVMTGWHSRVPGAGPGGPGGILVLKNIIRNRL